MSRVAPLAAGVLAAAMLGLPATEPMAEENFPERPITIMVGFAPGGIVDLPMRYLASVASDYLDGQPIVVVNRPGGGGAVAADAVAKSRPDGYTLYAPWGGAATVVRSIVQPLPFDVFDDFAPIASFVTNDAVLVVRGDSPYETASDLVEGLRDNPGGLSWGHTGRFGIHHLAGLGFLTENELNAQDIPYDGGTGARAALLAGDVDFAFFAPFLTPDFVEAGQLRVLGLVQDERHQRFTDYPTLGEEGVGYIPVGFTLAVAAPAGTPDDRIQKLAEAFEAMMDHPAFLNSMNNAGLPISFMGPEETLAYGRSLYEQWKPIIEGMSID